MSIFTAYKRAKDREFGMLTSNHFARSISITPVGKMGLTASTSSALQGINFCHGMLQAHRGEEQASLCCPFNNLGQ